MKIEDEREEAKRKAMKALAGYKFQMFGYWAAIWVHMNRLCKTKQASPFKAMVHAAREAMRT